MIASLWLMLSGLMYSLQLSTGSFPKPLTEEEEQHYLELAARGDLEARNTLIERNLRLVAHIMKKYYASESDQEDLISIGTIGLIKGISTFDVSKGARLATYAARCVENAIRTPMRFRWKESPEPSSDRFRALLYGFDDCIQKFLFLRGGAGQISDCSADDIGMDLRDPARQFSQSFGCFGYMDGYANWCVGSDQITPSFCGSIFPAVNGYAAIRTHTLK